MNTCYFVVVQLHGACGAGWMAEPQKEFEHFGLRVPVAVPDGHFGGVQRSAEVVKMRMMLEDIPYKAVVCFVEADLDGTETVVKLEVGLEVDLMLVCNLVAETVLVG